MADPETPPAPPPAIVPEDAEAFAEALQGAIQATPVFKQVPHGDGTVIINPAAVVAIEPRGDKTLVLFAGTSLIVNAMYDDVADAIIDDQPEPDPEP